ncbi:hypothetical protein QQ054_25810 [Oscillatoria amoena NRMC-F 0135]|nr:hypothetical protein [Oscillatoria amoena NRMC-F 0135]
MSTPVVLAEQTFTEDIYRIKGKFIVLIPVTWTELKPAEKDLLTKVLKAIHIPLSAVQILSLEQADNTFLNQFKPSFVLSFGVPITELDTQYSITSILGAEVIWSDGLKEIDQAGKEKLWLILKNRFLAQ